ncbi:MAG TPA: hypothetical protein VN736_05060 [Candidatus Limnocylindrales bacterium]|nr:hypothetical protein [Candidatus Limnocylindrales bacterium]
MVIDPAVRAQPVFHDSQAAQVSFASSEIARALGPKRATADHALSDLSSSASSLRFAIAADAAESKALAQTLHVAPLRTTTPQSYAIRRTEQRGRVTIAVLAADANGAMYGGLDVAEAIRQGTIGKTGDSDHTPHIAQRVIKFNIPLDRRTPTYSDSSDSAQSNIPEMWSMDFWHELFDEMARQRFNTISLWNLHPFPSIVKVPEYPDVALNDVWGNREPFDLKFNMNAKTMSLPFQLGQIAVVVNHMTIDNKIRIWRDVMQYGAKTAAPVLGDAGCAHHARGPFGSRLTHWLRSAIRAENGQVPILHVEREVRSRDPGGHCGGGRRADARHTGFCSGEDLVHGV